MPRGLSPPFFSCRRQRLELIYVLRRSGPALICPSCIHLCSSLFISFIGYCSVLVCPFDACRHRLRPPTHSWLVYLDLYIVLALRGYPEKPLKIPLHTAWPPRRFSSPYREWSWTMSDNVVDTSSSLPRSCDTHGVRRVLGTGRYTAWACARYGQDPAMSASARSGGMSVLDDMTLG
jgi:hypothetical protein